MVAVRNEVAAQRAGVRVQNRLQSVHIGDHRSRRRVSRHRHVRSNPPPDVIHDLLFSEVVEEVVVVPSYNLSVLSLDPTVS